MANYKVVDADQLDTDLTAVADSIRARAGTAEALAFPEGFKSAVEGIPDLLEQRISNTLIEYVNERVTFLYGSSFASCKELVKLYLPNVTLTEGYVFQNCSALKDTNFDSVTSFGEWGFHNCFALQKIKLPKLQYIHPNLFYNCIGLTALILPIETRLVVLSNIDAFTLTHIPNGTGYIYVPSALLDSYKAATNWSTYADQIRAIEDYPEECGYTKLVLDGTQTIGIPDYNSEAVSNTSGVYGGTHFEVELPDNAMTDVIMPPEFTLVTHIGFAENKGKYPIYNVLEWEGKKYLGMSLATSDVGTTVDTIKAWLAQNNIVYYVLMEE